MTDFNIQLCYLMDQYPLYRYIWTEGRQKKLSVLLLGSGSRFDTLLQKVLTGGQMLDTELDITVVSDRATRIGDALMERAPELGTFVKIFKGTKARNEPKSCYAVLCFENEPLKPEYMERILGERMKSSYILVSTGDDKKNAQLAEACGQCSFEQKTLVAYVQNKAPVSVPEVTKNVDIQPFGYRTKERKAYQEKLEQIALNLHYSYAKAQDERQSMAGISREFEKDYNFASNLENAVHLRSKLASCGIELNDPKLAAKEFHEIISENPKLVERQAALEHRRWVLEKVMQGYRQVENLDLIYSAPGVTTHDSRAKWHSCLVPCNEEGESSLNPGDWRRNDAETRQDRDALDLMSLRLHQKCGELAKQNGPGIRRAFKTLLEILSEDSQSYEALKAAERLEQVISLIYQQKKSALSMYETELHTLEGLIGEMDVGRRYQPEQQVELLKTMVAPLLEFVRCRDYKGMDRLLVRQIPFVLTHRTEAALVKLMSRQNVENVLSAIYLEPTAFIFIDIADNMEEVHRIEEQARCIHIYLQKRNLTATEEYHVFVPDTLVMEPELEEAWSCTLHTVKSGNAALVSQQMAELLDAVRADYIDVTGGAPALFMAVEQWANTHPVGQIFTKNGKLCGLNNACEIEYDTLYRSMNVADMFDLSGAVLTDSTGQKLSDLTGCYQKLWEIAFRYKWVWSSFCDRVGKGIQEKEDDSLSLSKGLPGQPWLPNRISISNEAMNAFLPSLRTLEHLGYLRGLEAEPAFGNQVVLHFETPGGVVAEKQLKQFLQRKAKEFHSFMQCTIEQKNGTKVLSITETICQMPSKGDFGKIINELEQARLIDNVVRNADTASFCVVLPELRECMKKAGTVLEYYLYYTAILDAHFDDVETGWSFRHSTEAGAASNELDVICTKGMTSLFISAKFRKEEEFLEGNQLTPLNYMLYEIMQMSQFGLNSKAILAAPFLPQFNPQTGELSRYARAAQRRGAYLLGAECFRRGKLWQVLDAIAEGKEDWYESVR